MPNNPNNHQPTTSKIPFRCLQSSATPSSSSTSALVKYNEAQQKHVYQWAELKKEYILGKRKQTPEGIWYSESYTLQELCSKYGGSIAMYKSRCNAEQWVALRKAYLSKINDSNAGKELDLYASSNYVSEVSTLTTCERINTILTEYLQYAYEPIFQEDKNPLDMADVFENRPFLLKELKEVAAITKEVYGIQRRIYDYQQEVLADSEPLKLPSSNTNTNTSTASLGSFKNEKERKAKILQLQEKLSNLLKPTEVVTTEAITTEEAS